MQKRFEIFACIYPTAPFITAEELQDAMVKLKTENADTVIPVVVYSFLPQRGFIEANGHLRWLYPEHECTGSQDSEKIYHDAGQYYMCRTEPFLEKGTFIMPRTVPVIKEEMMVQDIDTEEDWKLAEMKYRILRERTP